MVNLLPSIPHRESTYHKHSTNAPVIELFAENHKACQIFRKEKCCDALHNDYDLCRHLQNVWTGDVCCGNRSSPLKNFLLSRINIFVCLVPLHNGFPLRYHNLIMISLGKEKVQKLLCCDLMSPHSKL